MSESSEMSDTGEINKLFAQLKASRKAPLPQKEAEKEEKKDGAIGYKCKYCQEYALVEDDGYWVCSSCSKVNGPILSSGQEWRSFSDSRSQFAQDPSRCGLPVNDLLPQSSLGTMIKGRGSQGFRLVQLQNSMPSSERALWDAMKIIRKLCIELQIPKKISDKACKLYCALAKNTKMPRGGTRRGVMACCVGAFCKTYNFFVSPTDMAKTMRIQMKNLNDGAKLFREIYHRKSVTRNKDQSIGKVYSQRRKALTDPTLPENLIVKVGELLAFSEEEVACVICVARRVAKWGLINEKMPQSIAAGCLLLYSKHKKMGYSIKKIAKLCNVSDITAQKTHEELRAAEKYLIPKTKKEVTGGKVGNCLPPKKLEKIYTGYTTFLPKIWLKAPLVKSSS